MDEFCLINVVVAPKIGLTVDLPVSPYVSIRPLSAVRHIIHCQHLQHVLMYLRLGGHPPSSIAITLLHQVEICIACVAEPDRCGGRQPRGGFEAFAGGAGVGGRHVVVEVVDFAV